MGPRAVSDTETTPKVGAVAATLCVGTVAKRDVSGGFRRNATAYSDGAFSDNIPHGGRRIVAQTDKGAARRGRWAVAAMFLANGFVMGAWAPQIPLLLPRHGIGEATLGLLILGLGLGAVAAMAFSGALIGRFGPRPVLIVFALAMAPMLPLVVLAPGLIPLALAMALMGGLIGCMDVAMNANAVEVERALGRAIMSSSHGFWSLGGFIGGGLGSLALDRWGAEAQAMGVAGLTLLLVLSARPFLFVAPPAPTAATEGPVPGRSFLPRDPALWLLGVMALCCMVPEGAVLDWAALYLRQELGASVSVAGLAFALFSGTMAVMRFAGDALRYRFGGVRSLRTSALIGAAGLIAAALAPKPELALAGFALAGLGVANLVPVLFSAAGNHPGLPHGAGIATVTMLGYAGILVAPGTIGFVAEAIGFRVTYAALALLLLAVAALAGRAHRADAVS